MPVNDELGKRIKENYEERAKTKLVRRMPVMIRIDGKSFHTFTKGFKKPFDRLLMTSMQETMKYLCENIQGCVLGYTQSDEITLVLQDYKELTTDAFFNYEVQKICSIVASMATLAFNRIFSRNICDLAAHENEEILKIHKLKYGDNESESEFNEFCAKCEETRNKYKKYFEAAQKGAMFDARCFNVPKEEVCNAIYWRQLDATRNSIQMVGQAYFSHKELQNKSCNQIQDMLHEQKDINWNDFPTDCKRGSCCIKLNELLSYLIKSDGPRLLHLEVGNMSNEEIEKRLKEIKNKIKEKNLIFTDSNFSTELELGGATKLKHELGSWIIDKEIPIFVNEGRDYIERLINFN